MKGGRSWGPLEELGSWILPPSSPLAHLWLTLAKDQRTRSLGINPAWQVWSSVTGSRGEDEPGRHTNNRTGASALTCTQSNKALPKQSKARPRVRGSSSRSLPGILTPENKTRGNVVFDFSANEIINQNHRESLPTQFCSSAYVYLRKPSH